VRQLFVIKALEREDSNMANEIPVYMITGFLEGGKTSFLKFTLQQDYFNDGSKTLLILCEEGETELDQEFMDKYHVVTETIEEESELNREYFREVGKRHKPDRVIIEYNGMWSPKNITQLPFPYSDNHCSRWKHLPAVLK
jgi:putative membrane protein